MAVTDPIAFICGPTPFVESVADAFLTLGKTSAVGALMLHGKAMGVVLRCPACAQVMIVVTAPGGSWCLDLRGVRIMRMAAPA